MMAPPKQRIVVPPEQSPPDIIGITEAQRKYDLELAASMQQMAKWTTKYSVKVADTLTTAADRINALTMSLPVIEPLAPEAKPADIQPASTPDRTLNR